jgi:hypothetical protein
MSLHTLFLLNKCQTNVLQAIGGKFSRFCTFICILEAEIYVKIIVTKNVCNLYTILQTY